MIITCSAFKILIILLKYYANCIILKMQASRFILTLIMII